jgi:UDP-glucose 4-epimerase
MDMTPQRILVTGGAGYIGSHTCVELLNAGHDVVVVDNFSNSSPVALERVAEISGRAPTLVEADLLDGAALDNAFAEHQPDSVVHFAGCKAVGESMRDPLKYYRNNVGATISLLEAMQAHSVRDLVFSSSCTVYGTPDTLPLTEDAPLRTTNPYGASKLMVENVLRELATRTPDWNISILRYFNPVGAHPSGRIGEDPNGVPENLLPYVSQVAVGRRDYLRVWGDQYPTVDGTGVRDYIHVCDLARGHLAALRALENGPGLITHNLGTGQGHSVLQVVQAFEAATGVEIPYRIEAARPGDIAENYADPSRAERELGWKARRSLEEMCADAWRWQQSNPDGYRG